MCIFSLDKGILLETYFFIIIMKRIIAETNLQFILKVEYCINFIYVNIDPSTWLLTPRTQSIE